MAGGGDGGRGLDRAAAAAVAVEVKVVVGAGRAVEADGGAHVDVAVVVLGEAEEVPGLAVPGVVEGPGARVAAHGTDVDHGPGAGRIVVAIEALVDGAVAVLVGAGAVAQLGGRAGGVAAEEVAAAAGDHALVAEVAVGSVAGEADGGVLGAVGAGRIAVLVAAAAQVAAGGGLVAAGPATALVAGPDSFAAEVGVAVAVAGHVDVEALVGGAVAVLVAVGAAQLLGRGAGLGVALGAEAVRGADGGGRDPAGADPDLARLADARVALVGVTVAVVVGAVAALAVRIRIAGGGVDPGVDLRGGGASVFLLTRVRGRAGPGHEHQQHGDEQTSDHRRLLGISETIYVSRELPGNPKNPECGQAIIGVDVLGGPEESGRVAGQVSSKWDCSRSLSAFDWESGGRRSPACGTGGSSRRERIACAPVPSAPSKYCTAAGAERSAPELGW